MRGFCFADGGEIYSRGRGRVMERGSVGIRVKLAGDTSPRSQAPLGNEPALEAPASFFS